MNACSRAVTDGAAVLAAIDGSDTSWQVLTWAAHEAMSRRTGLTILHVSGDPLMWEPVTIAPWAPGSLLLREQALRLLTMAEEHVRTVTPGVPTQAVLRTGSPARVIRSEAKRASITVLGRGREHGRSVTSRVIARPSSPVTLVGSAEPEAKAAVTRVVAVLGPGLPTSTVLAVLDMALTTARRRGCGATVVADWSAVWQAGLAGAILRNCACVAGDVDVRTQSLGTSASLSLPLPVELLSASMVVLASPRRHRLGRAARVMVDSSLRSRGGPITLVPDA
jgi:nucleotide-binding universal stress UspA family protein